MGQWTVSDADMRRAIGLDPDNASARLTFARQLIVRGLVDEAVDQLLRASKLEPLSPVVAAWLSYAWFMKGDSANALTESARAIQLDPDLLPAANLGALLHLALGHRNIARQVIAAASDRQMTNGTYVYAALGDTAAANRIVRVMGESTPRPWYVDVARASVLIAIGDSAGALSALERSARDSGPLWVFFIPLGDPAYDLIRRSPRFATLLGEAHVDLEVVSHPRRTPH
jgi:tetratricopeptide (TPR) repeat protein